MSSQLSNTSFKFIALGAGNEVGRSCHILSYKGKTIMLDAGVHPAYQGMASLPFYDDYDLSTVDILLISHFHLDHAASLPYVMQRTNFKGRVFMTHPTKAIYRWLLRDFVRVTSIGENSILDKDDNLYTDEDLVESFDKIETIDFHSTVDVNGIKFTAFHAGHVLGAAMFQIEIAGLKVLFTGDYSRELDRHLNSAEVPPLPSDVLIVESTFGTATHEPRLNREKKLTQIIHSTVAKGGRVLMPVFALGRAQELMLILEEYWTQHAEELAGNQVPIYYASDLARKCMNVFQTYVNMMNDDIRKKFRDSQTNPFIFKHISYLKNLDEFQDFGPSVMLASPGMLQSGISRDLLEKWCPEEKNLVLITGYSVEGTMAKYIMLEPDTIPSVNNPDITIPRRCQVDEISFAAHVDFQENLEFIEKINATNIILVHGESNPMGRLKSALLSNFASLKGTPEEVHVYNPRNSVDVVLEYKGVKVAKALGNIVDEIQREGVDNLIPEEPLSENIKPESTEGKVDATTTQNKQDDIVVSGILVSDEKNFDLNLVSLTDLREHHTELSSTILKERQMISVNCKPELIYWHICQMFGDVAVLEDTENVTIQVKKESKEAPKEASENSIQSLTLQVMGGIKIFIRDGVATVEWTQDLISDTVADSIIAILMSVDSAPASVKMSSKTCSHDHENSEYLEELESEKNEAWKVKQVVELFREHFGESFELAMDDKEIIKGKITMGKNNAEINFSEMKIGECNSNPLKGRVESILNIGADLVATLC
ncbi:similar to Saccharomyces cerevisiae YOR179C SYC1 Subunit of the APT subcomplex of cleavage and polyadenylation factor [Maudiozyma saulgeensis]|uniref:Endoribonuclease YSH1 n=1 Tax=Maudiozyma saulgeensis TaxID=1789683 RepID=A0A1X7R6P3_9SACH|nr:similar to Saccharomyces cerevisiae YOR179C SYC1 Subunit of the APT subcomplex of cleavage and polyadenylation factor [Kazachstania saulgeensis]